MGRDKPPKSNKGKKPAVDPTAQPSPKRGGQTAAPAAQPASSEPPQPQWVRSSAPPPRRPKPSSPPVPGATVHTFLKFILFPHTPRYISPPQASWVPGVLWIEENQWDKRIPKEVVQKYRRGDDRKARPPAPVNSPLSLSPPDGLA